MAAQAREARMIGRWTTPPRLAPRPALAAPNARGQGERLREEIISAAVQMLGDLADDEALSLRAVARAVSISPTSVYLYSSLIVTRWSGRPWNAAMRRWSRRRDEGEAAHQDPALALRARILAQAAWVQEHPGLYKVMHESKVGMPFKEVLFTRTTAAVQRCMDAGVASPGDAATVALDLRTAVIGMLSLRINEPDLPWPPFPEQADRFLAKVVGLALPAGETTASSSKQARAFACPGCSGSRLRRARGTRKVW